jgi:predicted outer membrane repeat protein
MARLHHNSPKTAKRFCQSRTSKGNRCQRSLRIESLENRRVLSNLWVNSTADTIHFGDNLLTLREAILVHDLPAQYGSQLSGAEKSLVTDFSSLGKGLDTIHLEGLQGAVFDLNSALPLLKGQLAILGAGPGKSTVERYNMGNTFRIFSVDANATVTLSGLTIAQGNAENGGGIFNRGALTTVTNCDIRYDNANYAGGGIFNDVNSKMIINDSTIEHCMTCFDGGGGIYNQGTMELHHVTVMRCSVAIGYGSRPVEAIAGGGIYNSGTMTINKNSDIRENHGTWGAGIENVGYRGHDQTKRCNATLTISDSKVQGNVANYSQYYEGPTPIPMGGGVHNKWATLNVSKCTFASNQVNGYLGGAICNLEGTLNVSASTFDSNSVKCSSDNWPDHPAGGGAIYSWNSGSVVQIQDSCQFINNSAFSSSGNAGKGGAILCIGDLHVNRGRNYFYQNTADLDGGAIYCDGWLSIAGAELDKNTANREGGAIYATGHEIRVSDCVFGILVPNPSPTHVAPGGGNHAARGGAISNHTTGTNDPGSIRRSTFQYNTATGSGGAIYNATSLLLDTCALYGNQAAQGAGICNLASGSSKLAVVYTTLDANLSSGNGGGIFNAGNLDVNASTISNCSAGQGTTNGGGLYNAISGHANLTNCTLWANIAASGGGIYSLGDLDLLFDTIARNAAYKVGGVGGVCEKTELKTAHLHARNTIIAKNQAVNQAAQFTPSDLVTNAVDSVFACCLIGNGDGTGADLVHNHNLYGTYSKPLDPKIDDLADNGGPTKTCRLHADSKAYAAGSPDANVKWDQRGIGRKDTPDIGAYELHLYK